MRLVQEGFCTGWGNCFIIELRWLEGSSFLFLPVGEQSSMVGILPRLASVALLTIFNVDARVLEEYTPSRTAQNSDRKPEDHSCDGSRGLRLGTSPHHASFKYILK